MTVWRLVLVTTAFLLAGCTEAAGPIDETEGFDDPVPLPGSFDKPICELSCGGYGTGLVFGFDGGAFNDHAFRLERWARMDIDMQGKDGSEIGVLVFYEGRALDLRVGPSDANTEQHTWILPPGDYELWFLLDGTANPAFFVEMEVPRFVGTFHELPAQPS